jgi:hypothetical protein
MDGKKHAISNTTKEPYNISFFCLHAQEQIHLCPMQATHIMI